MLTLTASGSVSDYTDTSDLQDSIAANAGVDAASVSIHVAAASVIITATIAVPASTTPAAVQATLFSTLGTAASASAALGITVESVPSITESPATTPTGSGDGNTEAAQPEASGGGTPIAAIGGGAAVLAILLIMGLGFVYLRKKRTASSQSSIPLTAISLTTSNEKDLEGGGGAPATKGSTATSTTTTYTVELTKTPMGLGIRLTDDVVNEIKPDSQAARDGRVKVGDRVVTVNGEAPTKAKSTSTILQATSAGTIVTLELTSEPRAAVSAVTEMAQSSSVSADPRMLSPSGRHTQTTPIAVLARDSQKMRRAAELLESWKLEPSELIHGDKVGAGGQADVYLGTWQVSSRTSALLGRGSDRRYMLALRSFYTLDYLPPTPTFHPRGCPSRSRSSAAATIARRARRRCAPSPRPCAARCARSRACATQTWSGCTERAWSSHRAS